MRSRLLPHPTRVRTGLLALAALLAVQAAAAQGIDFFAGSYREALAEADRAGKLVFVDAFAVWCGPCKRMSNQVFPREDVGAFHNEHFVNLKLDMERGDGKAFAREFGVSSYPTLLYLDADGQLVHRVVGAQAPEALIQQGQLALRKTDNSADYAKRYREGERDPEFVLAYVRSLNKAGKPVLSIANEFLRERAAEHATPAIQAVIYEAAVQVDSRVFGFFLEQREALEATFGAAAVAERIEAAAARTLRNGLTYNSDKLVEQAKAAVAEHVPARAKAFAAHADLAVAKERRDAGLAHKAARKVVLAEGNTAAANHAMANELYRYFPKQPKALELATRMAGTAAKAEPSFDHAFTYATLLAAQGKDRKARAQAEAARALIGEGDDPRRVAMVQELIDRLAS